MRRIRSHLSYANVMSTIAVFIVLGGGAYAATKIGSSDIARNAIRSKHVKDNQIRVQDLAAEAKGARAFALAGRASGFNSRIAHRGFISAKKDSDGVYCWTPKPGRVSIPSTDPPTITPEYYSSNNYDLLAYWGASSSECGDGDYEVRTYAFAGGGQPVLSDQVRFRDRRPVVEALEAAGLKE